MDLNTFWELVSRCDADASDQAERHEWPARARSARSASEIADFAAHPQSAAVGRGGAPGAVPVPGLSFADFAGVAAEVS